MKNTSSKPVHFLLLKNPLSLKEHQSIPIYHNRNEDNIFPYNELQPSMQAFTSLAQNRK